MVPLVLPLALLWSVSGCEAGREGDVDVVDPALARAAPTHPFGTHPLIYPPDVLHPSGSQNDIDAATASAYDSWKAKYVRQGCGGYYVLSGGGTGPDVGDEVSEGHGYGMVITALMAGHDSNARTIFDGMYTFFHKFPTATHKNLMAWTVNVAGGCKIPSGQSDSASDGDLDIGFALLLADKQWPNSGYLQKAQAVIADLKSGDMHQTTHEPVLGDWATPGDAQYNATRPSDFMLEHFRAFKVASGDADWNRGVDNVYQLLATLQTSFSPHTGLIPDFVVDTTTSPKPAPPNFLEGPGDGQYNYNSCRVPWRLSTDYIVSRDARAKTAIQKMNSWIMAKTNKDPSKILDGYTLAGGKGAGQSGPASAFSSPFGVAALLGTDQGWLDKLWKSRKIDEDYYGDSITMVSMIVMSGNWWAP
jgi:endo-1,4-beta-D-glucanase Y